MMRIFLMSVAIVLAAGPAYSQETIRIWGDGHMSQVIHALEDRFEKAHPNARFDNRLLGTGTAMAGLYTGVADLAFMGRAATAKEIMAFEWVFRYKPQSIDVMTGSLSMPGKSPALVVFVHKTNPISRLTLAQIDAIFGCERRRGLTGIYTWGQLNLEGEWMGQAIHAYGYDAETGSGEFFQHTVLNDSRKWNWDVVKEFQDARRSDGSPDEASRQILDALARDVNGIGVACLCSDNSLVKPISLATDEAGPYWDATPENLIRGTYPLGRVISVYVNRMPDKPLAPKVAEFIRYVLSTEGQEIVSQDGDYLPLGGEALRRQLEKLD
jgi:phosphate transport system substrate-binding protein